MDICETYKISCPYALNEFTKEYASLPCIGTQEQCNQYRGSLNSDNSKKDKGTLEEYLNNVPLL